MTGAERHTIAAELPAVLERLREGASPTGAVSHRAFHQEAARLGLTTEEQQRRLRSGLASLGLRVKPSGRQPGRAAPPSAAPADADPPATGPAAPDDGAGQRLSTDRVSPRRAGVLVRARRMLDRYAGPDGTVSRLALDGVARLHGLSPAQLRELAAGLPVGVSGHSRTPAENLSVTRTSARASHPGDDVPRATPLMEEELPGAVRAARTVLEDDRWRRKPAKRLLTAEEEVGLAVLLRGSTGRLNRDLPAGEVAALPRNGERWRAYECLVLHNQGLVWRVTQAYEGQGLDSADLAQHGTLGLMRAVRKFDATKGNKFSTYATWWIRQSITRAIADEGALIRVPVHMHEKVRKVARAERRLLGEGRARTVADVAYASGLTFAEVEEARRLSRPTDSLDRTIAGDISLAELVIGPSLLPGPAAVLVRKEFHARLRCLLELLPERDRHILVRRTGLDGDDADTLETIGAHFGVTRERIRQIEVKAKEQFRDELVRHRLLPSAG